MGSLDTTKWKYIKAVFHPKILHLFLLLWLSLICIVNAHADGQKIKLAFLDTPYNEMPLNLSLLSEFQKGYLAGAEVAAYEAKKYGMQLVYKPFSYGDGHIDILDEIPKIQQWNADWVLGPSSSDQFLMLKNYLQDRLVLTAFASDENLKLLPQNFHSIFLSDEIIMDLLAEHIKKYYPEKNVFMVMQADCKQCVDCGNLFMRHYNMSAPHKQVKQVTMILDDPKTIDGKKLLAGHEDDVILIFNNTFYAYNELIKHLASFYPNQPMIFFSDQDNWGAVTNSPQKLSNVAYKSYRIGPLLLDSELPYYKKFEKSYLEIFHREPTASVSYMNYMAVMSVIEALRLFPNNATDMREKILRSYTAALAKDPNWFLIKNYGIYQLTDSGEFLMERLPLPKL